MENSDDVYDGLVTGCALAGPAGCSIATEGQSPADVDKTIQTILGLAHDAARKNPSAPLTSGQLRSEWSLNIIDNLRIDKTRVAALYGFMYFPRLWENLTNSVFPEEFQIVEQESQGSSNVTKRSQLVNRGYVPSIRWVVCRSESKLLA